MDDENSAGTSNRSSNYGVDTTSRRRFLAGVGAVGAAGLAGCTTGDVLLGDDPVEFTAETATVADEALEGTGYELHEITDETMVVDVSTAGLTREVRVTNRTAEYDRAIELFGERYQAAVFSVLSTPTTQILGRSYNPIEELEHDELAEMIQERYDEVHDVERGTEYSTNVLDEDASIVVYSARGDIAGTGLTVDLEMHISDPVPAGDDLVLCLAAFPEAFGDGENARRMMNGVVHAQA